jgi:hypothetical protein
MEKDRYVIVNPRYVEDGVSKIRYRDKLLVRAVVAGKIVITKMLIFLGADPSIDKDTPVRASVIFNHPEIFKFLLRDDRINKDNITKYAMSYGIKKGYDEILNIMLDNKEIDPTANNRPIKYALARGKMDIVNKLVKDDRFVDALMNEDEELHRRMTI